MGYIRWKGNKGNFSQEWDGTDVFLEVKRYFETRNIERKDDSLLWWKENGPLFPHFMQVASKYLAIPGSSVPSEQLFSQAGELISKRRSQLKPKNVDMILFSNKNPAWLYSDYLILIIVYSYLLYSQLMFLHMCTWTVLDIGITMKYLVSPTSTWKVHCRPVLVLIRHLNFCYSANSPNTMEKHLVTF